VSTAAPVPRRSTRPGPPDITLLNLNLMLAKDDRGIDRQVYTPLGVLYLAAMLEPLGYNVEFVDYQVYAEAERFDHRGFVDALGRTADVVGISCMANLLPFALLVAQALKAQDPQRTIVLGGVGPSPVAEKIVETFPFVDSVVEGEGELAIVEIMRGNVAKRPSPARVQRLDELPLPAYHLLDYGRYDAAPSVITSRGCPFKCTFCTEPYNFGGGVRFRSVERVLEEIELVHRLSGRTLFLFQDDILPLKPSRFHRLLEGLRNLSFPIEWKCFSRVDLMTEELMYEMAASGCVQIRYGIEAGHNRTLLRIMKQFTIEKAYEMTALSVRHFPSVHVSFIWGYPFENVREYLETLKQVQRFQDLGATTLLFELSPLPGSPLYQQYRDDLVFREEDYSFYVLGGFETVTAERFETNGEFSSIYDLIRGHPDIFSGFYRYANTDHARRQALGEELARTRRSRIRNEYDL
jgi:anaerobic magnesium-protoporphyrin IX monomethyl ester cyclase